MSETRFDLQIVLQIVVLLMLVCGLLTAPLVEAQQTTERYVPIGQSPGVSGSYSAIGNIIALDGAARTITVNSEDGPRSFRVTSATRVWFDRSKAGRENTLAGYEDCEVGVKVEVMHLRNDERVAGWIKIESK